MSRSFSPGNWRSRSSTRPSTVWPLAWISALPFVSERSGVGIRTSTGMRVPPTPRGLEGGQRAVEGRQRRLDVHVGFEATGERVRRLEAVAGDADDDRLGPLDDPGLDELPRRGDRDAARGLGEDEIGRASCRERV